MPTKKSTKKAATRSRKKVARKKTAARKTAAKKKTVAKKKTAAKKKTTTRKTTAKKKTAAKKKKAAARRKTSTADLRARAAQAESQIQAGAAGGAPQVTDAMAISLGGVQLPNIDLANVDLTDIDVGKLEGQVKNIMNFIEENPVSAAAMALGAGVMLTSMYWDKITGNK